jgi:hypothetical protein
MNLAMNIVELVVQIWLGAGMGLTLLKVARRQTAGFKDIFTELRGHALQLLPMAVDAGRESLLSSAAHWFALWQTPGD